MDTDNDLIGSLIDEADGSADADDILDTGLPDGYEPAEGPSGTGGGGNGQIGAVIKFGSAATASRTSMSSRPVGFTKPPMAPLPVVSRLTQKVVQVVEETKEDDDVEEAPIEVVRAPPPLSIVIAPAALPVSDALPPDLEEEEESPMVAPISEHDAEAMMLELSGGARSVATVAEVVEVYEVPVVTQTAPAARPAPKAPTMLAAAPSLKTASLPDEILCVLILSEATVQLPNLRWQELAETLRVQRGNLLSGKAAAECREVPAVLHSAIHTYLTLAGGASCAALATHKHNGRNVIVCSQAIFDATLKRCVGSLEEMHAKAEKEIESLSNLLAELQIIRHS